MERAYALVLDLDDVESGHTSKSQDHQVQQYKHTSSSHQNRYYASSSTSDYKGKSVKKDSKGKNKKDFSKIGSTTKCYKCQGYGHVSTNYPCPTKIVIVNGVPEEASDSDSDEFSYQVDNDDDFSSDEDNIGNDVSLKCVRPSSSIHLTVVRCALSQPKDRRLETNHNVPHIHKDWRKYV